MPRRSLGGMNTSTSQIGTLLRDWRQRRRLSQLDLALDAQVSTRHLSFVETGRARPSRELILHLGELLELPLRERNRLLLAAGFAPQFAEHALDAPLLQPALDAVQRVLSAHEPFPAVAVDRHWNLLLSNDMARRLLHRVAPELLSPTANLMRISLHPQGLAPYILNLGEWRRRLLERLRRLVSRTADPVLESLLRELSAMSPLPGEQAGHGAESPMPEVVVLLRLETPVGELALFSTITVFGTPTDITLAEIALEAFYPADRQTADRLRLLAS